MNNFGFKIVDRNPLEIQPILTSSVENHHPLEIGFYFHNLQANEMIWQVLQDRDITLNTHLNHRVYHLSDLHEHLSALTGEINHIRQLGSDYSIIHVAPSPFDIARESNPVFFNKLLANLRLLNTLCEATNYAVYVENTFGGIEFYRKLFSHIAAEQLSSIHFCFDIGHAKIWSGNPLTAWIAFLQDLIGEGFKLHFHLHNNRGKFDDHLSFVESAYEGINRRDAYTGKHTYLQTLHNIEKLFPESRKIFEVKAAMAIENMNYVAAYLKADSRTV